MSEIRLRVYRSPSEFRTETYRQWRVTVGRDINSDIVVPEKEVSRLHCAFEHDEHGWRIVDLQSTNGTFLNGIKVQNTALRNGDVVVVGSTRLHVLDCTSGVAVAPISLEGYRLVQTLDVRSVIEPEKPPDAATRPAAVKGLARDDTAPEVHGPTLPALPVLSAAEILRGGRDLRALAKTIASRLMRDAIADVCLVYLCAPETQTFECAAAEPPGGGPSVPPDILNYVREHRVAVHVEGEEGAASQPGLRRAVGAPAPQAGRARAVMCGPVLDGPQLLGAIALVRGEMPWKDGQPILERLAVAGFLAASSLSCARSYGRLEEAHLELFDACSALPDSIGDRQQDRAELVLLDSTIQRLREALGQVLERSRGLAEQPESISSRTTALSDLAEATRQSAHFAERLSQLIHQRYEAAGETWPVTLLADFLPLLRELAGASLTINERVASELPAVGVAPRLVRATITRIVLFCRDRMRATRLTLTAELCGAEHPIVAEGYDEIAPGRYVLVCIEAEGDATAIEELRLLRDSEIVGLRDPRNPIAGLCWAAHTVRRAGARLIVRPPSDRAIGFDLYLPILTSSASHAA